MFGASGSGYLGPHKALPGRWAVPGRCCHVPGQRSFGSPSAEAPKGAEHIFRRAPSLFYWRPLIVFNEVEFWPSPPSGPLKYGHQESPLAYPPRKFAAVLLEFLVVENRILANYEPKAIYDSAALTRGTDGNRSIRLSTQST
jgi:hypothetical protein